MGPHGGWLNDERRGARPPANLEHRNPPVVSRGTPYSSPPPSPSHIRDLQHVMAQNKELLSVVAHSNHKIKAMQLQIDILEHRHNEHQAYMERMRACECHNGNDCADCKRVLSEDATCEAVAKQWANGESVPRPVIHTDGFHEWSGPWGGPSSRWAGQDGVGGSFGDGVRWVTEEDSDED